MVKYYNSPRWSNEIADCSMPMTLDTYSNCSYKCMYCFAQISRGIGRAKDDYIHNKVRNVDVNRIKRIFNNPESSMFGEYIKNRKVMQWGGLSDQFDENERKYGKTLELLRFFRKIDYPLCFSTKATWWLDDSRYTELFKDNPKWNVKFSIITLDEKKARIIEAGVDSPQKRLEAINKFTQLNAGGATLRLRPFIIGISTPTYLDLIKQAHQAGATAMSTEFLCIDRRSNSFKEKMHYFNELCGFDLMNFYIKYSTKKTGYLRLNRNIKKPFVENMKKLCDELGMRFYVSDSHFKEMCNNGCCCGLPESWNYSRGQWCNALMIAKKDGKVKYSDVKNDINEILKFPYKKTEHYATNCAIKRAKWEGMNTSDYMRWLWNNPSEGQSPYGLFNDVLKPNGKDKNGDLIYFFKDNF